MDIKDKYIGNDENKSLSTGQLVQLSILLNTMEIPDLLILDEPLSNLDIKTSIHIMNLLKELDIPIILTLHHPNNIILEGVDQLIVMEEGEIILNTSLLEISNRLEYYEQQVLGKTHDEPKTIIDTELTLLEVENHKNYIADISITMQFYNCVYNIVIYFSRNKTFQISYFLSYLPLIIIYVILHGTDFKDEKHGYLYLVNNVYSLSSTTTGFILVMLYEIQKLLEFIKRYTAVNIIHKKLFYLLYCVFISILISIYMIFQALSLSYLNENNIVLFPYIFYNLLFTKIVEVFWFNALMYLFENINISNTIWGILCMFQYLNSGLRTKNYEVLQNYSVYYHLLNILSIKAQEFYNYPLFENNEYIYTLYGYSSNITNSHYYLFCFLIIPLLTFIFYYKKSTFFLT